MTDTIAGLLAARVTDYPRSGVILLVVTGLVFLIVTWRVNRRGHALSVTGDAIDVPALPALPALPAPPSDPGAAGSTSGENEPHDI